MELTSVNAPAIGQKGLERLRAFARPKDLNSSSTLFDAGYEQAKRDFVRIINREVAAPAEASVEAEQVRIASLSPEENRARLAALAEMRKPWWIAAFSR